MDLDQVNATIRAAAPSLFQHLSALGRRAVFPRGIPFQAAEAASAEINGTIGQITDGRGGTRPLPVVAEGLSSLDPDLQRHSLLYSPMAGLPELRELWRARQRREAPQDAPSSLPIVTVGLTHGLSIIADLFISPETVVVLPAPFWGNYKQIFGLRRGAAVVGFPAYDGDRFRAEGYAEALDELPRGAAMVVLNFPSNPGGYSPSEAERAQIVEGLVAAAQKRRVLVLVDDAYHGLVYDAEIPRRSIFWDLLGKSEQLVPVKVCGTTKELVFFSGRVGFLTFACAPDSALAQALESKVKALIRSTVGSPVGPSQALALRALRHPELDAQTEAVRAELEARFLCLQQAYRQLNFRTLRLLPCNSGCFALFELQDDPEIWRRRLLAEQSVGMISVPPRYLRLAFSSVAEDNLVELLTRLKRMEDG